MKISVIMLTYNRQELVTRAIESILNQTFDDFEFIVVDNGSTDKSGAIADRYSAMDNRMKVIHTEKSSIGRGRNIGLESASGEFITFIDDDDIAYEDMLEFLYKLAVKEGADISICGSNKIVGGELLANCVYDEYKVMTPEEATVELLRRKKYNAAMPSKMFKKDLFKKIKFENNGKYDDITATYKYIANASKVVYWGLPKYCFYRHSGNNSAFTTNDNLLTPNQLDEYFEAFKERTIYLSELLPDIADYGQYSEWSYMISMCNKISKNNLTNCNKQLQFVKAELKSHFNEFYNSPYIEEFEKEFMRKYIKREMISCTGCGACQNICPNESIEMIEEQEGFLYPHINKDMCTSCDQCIKVCPEINEIKAKNITKPEVYAAWSKEKAVRHASSSGGIFTELAKKILSENGYIVGAKYNDENMVEHCIIGDLKDLTALQKSKYIQSIKNNIYREVKKLLDENKTVMFVGTPCEIAGIRGYLQKEYDNLLLCDLVCHGVNSPKVYRKYLSFIEEAYNSKILSIDFRDKSYGWDDFMIKIELEDNKIYAKHNKEDLFYRGFMKNLYLRPSCYSCSQKGIERMSDITLADFWGIDMDSEKKRDGVSLILINTMKGKEYFNKIKDNIYSENRTINDALIKNPSIIKSAYVDKDKRNEFFAKLDDGEINSLIEEMI